MAAAAAVPPPPSADSGDRGGAAGGAGADAGAERPTMLRIMPREMRLMSERILSLTGLPRGFLLAVRDVPMYSQLLGLGGFGLLEAQLEVLRAADPGRLRIAREDGVCLELDAQGQHAWIVLPALLDLAAELTQRCGRARLRVSDLAAPAELAVAAALAGRSGLQLGAPEASGGVAGPADAPGQSAALAAVALEARSRPPRGNLREDDPVLWAGLMQGTAIDSALWWRIYQLATQALEPDNPVSRRHAGTVIVLDDGRILGRADGDDETDLSFIAAASCEPRPAGDDSR